MSMYILKTVTVKLTISLASLFLFFSGGSVNGQSSFSFNTRYSFYSWEKEGEFLVHIPPSLVWNNIVLNIYNQESGVASWKGIPRSKMLRIPFQISMPEGKYILRSEIESGGKRYGTFAELLILPSKPNEVKVDRLTGGLIVSRRQFFPFGFYCYSPVYPTLPEEEVVKGFNVISPYQKLLPATAEERQAYMDRCAELGMKVHYNLLSVTGGGGVGSQIEGMTPGEKKEILIAEINRFMDHPALLAWYIADEPNGYRLPPAELEAIYNTVRAADPWHPVTVVFTAPFISAVKYSGAMDIVMADPYPIPDLPAKTAGNVAGQLSREFEGRKPVWIVPQAFGGGEHWKREPTVQEIRSMTYQAIVNGARGIQYFIRHGLNVFPKSVPAWNECGRMAVEIAELTPWLLSDEEAIPVSVDNADINVTSCLHSGVLMVMAVNTTSTPLRVNLRLKNGYRGDAFVIFENRTVKVQSGLLSDYIQAFGSQVYMIRLRPEENHISPYRDNLLRDPGFEDISSPGIPSACYAWITGDRGSTYFTDTREHFEGSHSLRLVTPEENRGVRLRFFPVPVKRGKTYVLSVWAKKDPWETSSPATDTRTVRKLAPATFELGLGEFGGKRFVPGDDWKQFVTNVTIPPDSNLPVRANVLLSMPGAGTAWFDMLQIFEAVDIGRSVNPALKPPWENFCDICSIN